MQHHVALSFRMSVFWLRAGATLHEAIYFGGGCPRGAPLRGETPAVVLLARAAAGIRPLAK